MIVDPWGTVLARAGDDAEAVVAATLDFEAQKAIRDKLPSLANRVPSAYSW
jgi:predicted amidohydrolase